MGAYINPPNKSKEEFLAEHGKELSEPPKRFDEHPGKLPVCLVDNGNFTAAGICFSQHELKSFNVQSDIRPKRWFIVDEEKLHTVSDELKRYQEAGR